MELGIEVGEGNFGKIHRGSLAMQDKKKPIECAIKTLKGNLF